MGVLKDPIDALAAMFRDSRPFAAWCGLPAWNATETAARVYVDGVGPGGREMQTMTREQLDALRPYVVLYPDDRGYKFTRDSAPNCWSGNGSIIAVLTRAYDGDQSIEEYWRQAATAIEKIISNDTVGEPGLLEMAGTAGYLAFSNVYVSFAGMTPPENVLEYGDAYDVLFLIEY
jgi:hypothetical protein